VKKRRSSGGTRPPRHRQIHITIASSCFLVVEKHKEERSSIWPTGDSHDPGRSKVQSLTPESSQCDLATRKRTTDILPPLSFFLLSYLSLRHRLIFFPLFLAIVDVAIIIRHTAGIITQTMILLRHS
jgi:hypothetical protein